MGEHAEFKIVQLLTDSDGSNYATKEFKHMLRANDVEHITITPHSAQQAGRIERAQGVYDSLTQAALDYAQMDPEFYVMAYVHAVEVRNMVSHSAINFEIPMD